MQIVPYSIILWLFFYFIVIGQSGGVDEELFTKSFEDVPKLQVGLSYENIHEDKPIHDYDIVSQVFLIHQNKWCSISKLYKGTWIIIWNIQHQKHFDQ